MNDLSDSQRRYLRGLGHALKPVVTLGGAGLTDAVASEAARALHDHELVKVRIRGADRAARTELLAELARRTDAALVHRIGHVALFYRPREPLPKIMLPDAQARRHS